MPNSLVCHWWNSGTFSMFRNMQQYKCAIWRYVSSFGLDSRSVNAMFPVHIIAVNILNKCLSQAGGILYMRWKYFRKSNIHMKLPWPAVLSGLCVVSCTGSYANCFTYTHLIKEGGYYCHLYCLKIENVWKGMEMCKGTKTVNGRLWANKQ
jgi:hypothetical protein